MFKVCNFMKQPKVSIIIPVYNAENTLSRCLDSVLQQSFTDLEIILIDDGSTDKSLEICQQYQDNYNCVRVIQQSNSGPAVARNQGIKYSTGKYLAFVDADDYVSNDMISSLVEKAESEFAEMVICAYWKVTKNSIKEQYYKFTEGVYEGNQAKKLLYSMIERDSMEDIPPFSCVRLVLRNAVTRQKLWFYKDLVRSEDFHFWCRVHQYVKRIYLLSKTPLYFYVDNDQSITHRYVAHYWGGAKFIYKDLLTFAGKDELYINKLNKMLIMRSMVALNNSTRCYTARKAIREIFQIVFDPCLYKAAKALPTGEITARKKYISLIRNHCRFLVFIKFVYRYFMNLAKNC